MKPKHLEAFIETAHTFSKCSTAEKLQVGAIIVKDNRIISIGYNGMPSGWSNVCEDKVYPNKEIYSDKEIEKLFPYVDEEGNRYDLRTKKEVLHAEANAITKLAQSVDCVDDSCVMFITHAPCIECAKLIYQSGIKKVIYENSYRLEEGINFLIESGTTVYKLDKKEV